MSSKLLICKIFILFALKFTFGKNVYKKLVGNILDNYDIGLRPVIDLDKTVNVGITFGIIQLLNVVSIFNIFNF